MAAVQVLFALPVFHFIARYFRLSATVLLAVRYRLRGFFHAFSLFAIGPKIDNVAHLLSSIPMVAFPAFCRSIVRFLRFYPLRAQLVRFFELPERGLRFKPID